MIFSFALPYRNFKNGIWRNNLVFIFGCLSIGPLTVYILSRKHKLSVVRIADDRVMRGFVNING